VRPRRKFTASRWLFWATVSVGFAFFAGIALTCFLRNSVEGRQRVEASLSEYDRMRAIAVYQETLKATEPSGDKAPFSELFLKPGTSALIAAEFLAKIKQDAANAGVEVTSTTDLPAKEDGPLRLIGGSLQLTGTSAAIYGLIQTVEASEPMMFVDRLTLVASNSPLDDGASDTILTGEIHVFGAARNAAESAKPDGN
jgi:Type II secretion system (T2SS), protein M subtype b